MSTARKAVLGVLWLGGMNNLSFGLSLAGNVVLARLLAPRQFGLFALALALYELLFILCSFGFPQAVVQMQSERGSAEAAYWLSFAAGMGVLALAVLASPVLARLYPAEVVHLFLLLCLSGLVNMQAGVYAAVLQRDFFFKELSVIQALSTGASFAVAILLAAGGAGLLSLGARAALQPVGYFLLCRAFCRWRYRGGLEPGSLGRLWGFGLRMFVLRALEVLYSRADRLLLGSLGMLQVAGLYHQARYLAELSNVAAAPAAVHVALPAYARCQHDRARLSEAYRVVNFFLVRALLPLALVLALYAQGLLHMLLGPQWVEAAPALRVLSLQALLMPLYGNLKTLLIGTGRLREAVRTRAVQVGAFGALMVVAVLWKEPLEGIAVALVLSMALGLALGFYYLKGFAVLSLGALYGRPLVAALLAGWVSVVARWAEEVLFMGATVATYGLLLGLLEGREVARNLRALLRRLGHAGG
jgi:PST family polysaccharide transporter